MYSPHPRSVVAHPSGVLAEVAAVACSADARILLVLALGAEA